MLYILSAMARTDPQVNFRIPADLLDQIKEAAATNNRTITAELVDRLQNSFLEPEVPLPEMSPDTTALLLRSRLSSLESMISTLQDQLMTAYEGKDAAQDLENELVSLQQYATTIRGALTFVVKSKYTGSEIPAEYHRLISDLSRLTF